MRTGPAFERHLNFTVLVDRDANLNLEVGMNKMNTNPTTSTGEGIKASCEHEHYIDDKIEIKPRDWTATPAKALENEIPTARPPNVYDQSPTPEQLKMLAKPENNTNMIGFPKRN